MTAASSMPSLHGLSNAKFCKICSDTDCGNSSKNPSEIAPSTTRRGNDLAGIAAISPAISAGPSLPFTSIVSTSPIPSFCAIRPPAKPIKPPSTPVVAPAKD